MPTRRSLQLLRKSKAMLKSTVPTPSPCQFSCSCFADQLKQTKYFALNFMARSASDGLAFHNFGLGMAGLIGNQI